MSKKSVLCLSGVSTALLIMYLAYEAKTYGFDTVSTFFNEYVNRTQKYLFNGCLYGIPLIYGLSKPFMSSEYRIRLKENIAYKLIIKSIVDAMFISVWIILLFIIASALMNIKIEIGNFFVTIYIRLTVLYAQCSGLYYLIYVVTNSEIIAVCSTMGINLLALISIILYDYIVEPLNEVSINVYLFYISISCLCAFIFLVYAIKYRVENI